MFKGRYWYFCTMGETRQISPQIYFLIIVKYTENVLIVVGKRLKEEKVKDT